MANCSTAILKNMTGGVDQEWRRARLRERFKAVGFLSAVAGLVASLPFWNWNGWLAVLVWAVVGTGLASLSKDNPLRK